MKSSSGLQLETQHPAFELFPHRLGLNAFVLFVWAMLAVLVLAAFTLFVFATLTLLLLAAFILFVLAALAVLVLAAFILFG
jgi:hypothetical protein